MRQPVNPVPARRPALLPLAVATGALLLSGCSGISTHFHDPKAAALATQLRTDFAAYRTEQPSLYAAMAANLSAFEAEEQALIDRFAQSYETALLTKAPTYTWKRLGDLIQETDDDLAALRTQVEADALKDLEARKRLKGTIGDLAGVIEALRADIENAKAEAAAWDAMIASIQAAVVKLPDVLASLETSAAGSRSIDTAVGELAAILEQTPQDRGDVLDRTAPLPEELRRALGTKLADAPGIAIRILELGLELAELKKERAQKQLIAQSQRERVFQDFVISARIVRSLNDRARDYLAKNDVEPGALIAASVLETKRRGEARDRAATSAGAREFVERQNSISYLLLMPRLAAGANWLVARERGLTSLRLARIRHQESIVTSEVGDRAWQALVASGLDGLVAYHEGGITDEDIANLIRLAQGVALFIIAA